MPTDTSLNNFNRFYELYSEFCKAIAHPMRLQILDLLRDKEKSLSELLLKFGTSKPNLSQHLKILKHQGIVTMKRKGSAVYYRIASNEVRELYDRIKNAVIEHIREDKNLIP